MSPSRTHKKSKKPGPRAVETALGSGLLVLLVPATLLSVDAAAQGDATRPLTADTGVSKARKGKAVIRADVPVGRTAPSGMRLSLDGFRIEGDPRLRPEALDAVLAPWKGRQLSYAEYEQAIHAVADYLRANGHPGAQVRLSRALVGQGRVMIAIEGLSPAKPVVAEAEVKPTVEVKGFRFTGVTLASEEELQAVVAGLTGRNLNADEMQAAAQSVANHLRAKGYPLVQAYLPQQRVEGGIVEIAVQEGALDTASGRGGITVSGAGERVDTEVVEAFLARGARPGEPLRAADLERAVMLTSDLAGIKDIKTEIEPGSTPGTTRITAKIEETPAFGGSIGADNYGSRYTGTGRLLGQLQWNSPTGHGEQLTLGMVSSSGLKSVRLGGQAPIGSDGWRVGGSIMSLRADLGLSVAVLNLNSQADVANAFVSYPLVRSPQNNVNLIGSYDTKHFVTDLTGGRDSDRQIRLVSFGAAGDVIDPFGGQTRWNAGFGVGGVDLSAHALNQSIDAANARTEGGFQKLNWQAARTAPVGASSEWSWQLSASGQTSSKNLDTAEKFQLGGPTGVRAYPVGEGLGDRGWLGSAELRYRIGQTPVGDANVFGFYDVGSITQFDRVFAGALPGRPNTYMLRGFGFGAGTSIGTQGGARVVWARKVGNNPNPTANNTDADDQNRRSRIWIIGTIVF
jgi:hemolysin activation/secretion protein